MQKTNFTGYECPPGVLPKSDLKFIEKNNTKYIYDSTFTKRRFVQDNDDNAKGIQYIQNTNNDITTNNYNTNNLNNGQYFQTNNWNNNNVNVNNQNTQNISYESNWNNIQNVQSNNNNWNNDQYNQNYNTNGFTNNYNDNNNNTNINILQSSEVNNRKNTTDARQYCELADICGLNMKVGDKPNQWYRFVIPIFLHAGVAHLAFNLVFQIRTGFPMEREYGTWRMIIIYIVSGIYGFMFEAKSVGYTPSVGCSGALYGLLACLLLDLIQSWKIVINAWKELLKLLFIIIVSFSFGLIPYIDNFAHIGGFIMGLLMGTIFLPIIVFSRRGLAIKRISMVLSLFASIILFFWSFRHFYFNEKVCKWCGYLNCIPIKDGWCNFSNTDF
ncbi:rhomboid-domain-containing protein [Neocallimastix sp. 'constans']